MVIKYRLGDPHVRAVVVCTGRRPGVFLTGGRNGGDPPHPPVCPSWGPCCSMPSPPWWRPHWRSVVGSPAIVCQSPYEGVGAPVLVTRLLPRRIRPLVQIEWTAEPRTANVALREPGPALLLSGSADRVAVRSLRHADRVRTVSEVLTKLARDHGLRRPDRPFRGLQRLPLRSTLPRPAPLPGSARPRAGLRRGAGGLQGSRRPARELAARGPEGARRAPDDRGGRGAPGRLAAHPGSPQTSTPTTASAWSAAHDPAPSRHSSSTPRPVPGAAFVFGRPGADRPRSNGAGAVRSWRHEWAGSKRCSRTGSTAGSSRSKITLSWRPAVPLTDVLSDTKRCERMGSKPGNGPPEARNPLPSSTKDGIARMAEWI